MRVLTAALLPVPASVLPPVRWSLWPAGQLFIYMKSLPREFGMDMYTLLCWKWTYRRTQVILLSYVAAWMAGVGGEEGRIDTCVCMAEWNTWVRSLGWEDLLEEGMATHSSILAWRTHMEPGGLQSMRLPRVEHDWATKHSIQQYKRGFPSGSVLKNPPASAGDSGNSEFNLWVGMTPWRRKWQPTPVFLPGK